MTDNSFEIPQSVRNLAEHNIRQTHAAYEQLTDFMTKAMGAWVGAMPSNPAAMGFKDIQTRAMEMATENAELAFAFAGKISNAKSVQEVLALQTQFTQDRMQAYVTHTREIYGLIEDVLRGMQRG